MIKSKLGIASVLVGCSKNNFHDRGDDGEGPRLDLMAACADAAIDAGCRVLVLPAGFFVAHSAEEQRALERRVRANLKDRKLVVAFGIDVFSGRNGASKAASNGSAAASNGSAESSYFPYGYVVEDGQYLISGTAQTGVRSNEVAKETVEEQLGKRYAASRLLDGATVGLLLCGEVLSPSWHAGFASIEPSLVLHLGHASIPLGGASKESWSAHVENLLQALPKGAVWAFSDHIRRMEHSESMTGAAVSLVRRSPGRPVPMVKDLSIEHEIPAWIYLHAVA